MTFYIIPNNSDLIHYGIKGQKWGIRRYQNSDGTLTAEGKERYSSYADPKKGVLDKFPGKDPVDAVGDYLINDSEARKRWVELNAQYHVAYQKYYWNNTKNSSKKENEDRLHAAEKNIDKFIKNLFGSEYLNKLSDKELIQLVVMEANAMAYTDDIHKEAWSLAYKIDSDAMNSEEKYHKNKIVHSEGDKIMSLYITSPNAELMHYGIHSVITGRRDLLDLAKHWINRTYKEKET